MNKQNLPLVGKDWNEEYQWSVRYLAIYDLPSGMAEKLIENIIADIIMECSQTNSPIYTKELFLKKLKQVIEKLKFGSYAA